jgi:hypothetical protein
MPNEYLDSVPETLSPSFNLEMTEDFLDSVKDEMEALGQNTSGIDLVVAVKAVWTKVYDVIVDRNG